MPVFEHERLAKLSDYRCFHCFPPPREGSRISSDQIHDLLPARARAGPVVRGRADLRPWGTDRLERTIGTDRERLTRIGGRAMKRVIVVLVVAAACAVLLAGRDDVRRFREMRRM